jgi:hypothetical protein
LLTYALADTGGAALRPSQFVHTQCAALPGLRPRRLGHPQRTRETWPILTARDLSASLAAELRHRPALALDDAAIRRRWNDLYDVARVQEGLGPTLRRALAALDQRNVASLSADSVQALVSSTYRARFRTESQAACPFQRLPGTPASPGQEAALQPVDVGSVHHQIPEGF